jgi:hypothetical protein
MASPREEAIFASEGQKTRMETYQVAVMFGNGGREIIEPQLTCDATHESERVDMTANERFKALAECELQVFRRRSVVPGIRRVNPSGVDEFAPFKCGERLDGFSDLLLSEPQVVEAL